jgi:hypothetical protein
VEIQYLKIDPYVYTHRFEDNNFTNGGYNLASELEPNSSSTNIILHYRPHYRVNLSLGFRYYVHALNEMDENGNIIKNNGADINIGHREIDSDKIYFLNGDKEYTRTFNLNTTYEPIKNWIFSISFDYSNNSESRSQHAEEFFSTFSVSTKL